MNDANDNIKDKHDGTYEDNEDPFADEDDDDKDADLMPDLVLDLDHLDYILYKAEAESGNLSPEFLIYPSIINRGDDH